MPRAVSKYKHTILARKNNQIVGARVGSIERFPWMATPLPTHMPEPVEIIKAFLEELTKKENYRKVGIKTGTKVYVAKILATRNDMRGLVSKIIRKLQYTSLVLRDISDILSPNQERWGKTQN